MQDNLDLTNQQQINQLSLNSSTAVFSQIKGPQLNTEQNGIDNMNRRYSSATIDNQVGSQQFNNFGEQKYEENIQSQPILTVNNSSVKCNSDSQNNISGLQPNDKLQIDLNNFPKAQQQKNDKKKQDDTILDFIIQNREKSQQNSPIHHHNTQHTNQNTEHEHEMEKTPDNFQRNQKRGKQTLNDQDSEYSFSDDDGRNKSTTKKSTINNGNNENINNRRVSQRQDIRFFKVVQDFSEIRKQMKKSQLGQQKTMEFKKFQQKLRQRTGTGQDKGLKHFFLINRIRNRFFALLEQTQSRRYINFYNLNLFRIINDYAIIQGSKHKSKEYDIESDFEDDFSMDEDDDDDEEGEKNKEKDVGFVKQGKSVEKRKSTRMSKMSIKARKKSCGQIISEKCSKINNKMHSLQRKCLRKLLKPKIFQPNNRFVTMINVLGALLIILIIFIYSVHIFFPFDLQNADFFPYLQYSCLIIFVTDIFTKFNTAVYIKGEFINERNKIKHIYMTKGSFYFDIISLAPLIYNIYSKESQITNYLVESLIFFKILAFYFVWKQIERYFYIYGERSYLFSFIELIFGLIVISHFIGIMYYSLGMYEYQHLKKNDSWITVIGIEDADWYTRYIESFYWAAATMMLVGTKGNNFIEVLFTSIVMFATVGVFAYLISSINIILEEVNKKTKDYQSDLEVINRYLRNKTVSENLQARVRNYLEYLHRASGDMTTSNEVSTVMDKLPSNLKEDIQIEVNSGHLVYIPFIYSHFSDRVLEQLVYKLEEVYYVPNEVIFRQGDSQDISIYLISKGEVQLYQERESVNNNHQQYMNQYDSNNKQQEFGEEEKQELQKQFIQNHQNQNKGTKIHQFKEKQVFGENSFCSGLAYEYTARSSKFSTVYKIKRDDFLQIIKGNNLDYEKFCLIKDQILHQGQSKHGQGFCYICNNKEHRENSCNTINYIPNKLNLIKKYEYSIPVENRQFVIRPYRKRIRALEECFNILEIREDLQEDLQLRPAILELQAVYEKAYQTLYDDEEDNSIENSDTYVDDDYYDEEQEDDYTDSENDDKFDDYKNRKKSQSTTSELSDLQYSRKQSIQSKKSLTQRRQSQSSRRPSLTSQNTLKSIKKASNLDVSESNLSINIINQGENKQQYINNITPTKQQDDKLKKKKKITYQDPINSKKNMRKLSLLKAKEADEKQIQQAREIIQKAQQILKTSIGQQAQQIQDMLSQGDYQGNGQINKSYNTLVSQKTLRFNKNPQELGSQNRQKELNKLQTNMNSADLQEVMFKIFDKQQEYKIYNPQNNLARVLQRYKHHMRFKLKKQRNKKYKLFSTRIKTFKSGEITSQMNLRMTVINPKTKTILKTIINKPALKMHNQNFSNNKFNNNFMLDEDGNITNPNQNRIRANIKKMTYSQKKTIIQQKDDGQMHVNFQ